MLEYGMLASSGSTGRNKRIEPENVRAPRRQTFRDGPEIPADLYSNGTVQQPGPVVESLQQQTPGLSGIVSDVQQLSCNADCGCRFEEALGGEVLFEA